MGKILSWFTLSWWRYLFHEDKYSGETSWSLSRYSEINKIQRAWCRARGHPAGPVWNNVGGLEPDMSCQYCGDDCG